MRGYSQDLRNKAMELYKTGNYNKTELAKMLSLEYATIRRWCDRYDETGHCLIMKPIKEGRHSIFTNKQAVLDYLQNNPDADGIELGNQLAPHVSQRCFTIHLAEWESHIKKEVNYKQRYEQKRLLFTKEIKGVSPENLIYIDETGIDNNLSKLRGCALKGVKSFTEALGFRTKRITLIGGYCYGTKELVTPMEYDGYTNSNLFYHGLSWHCVRN